MRPLRWLLVGAVGLAGCGLDLAGTAGGDGPDDAGAPDAVVTETGGPGDAGGGDDDISIDGPIDAPEEPGPPVPCPATGTTCSAAIPAGWKLLALAGAPPSSCPANFQQRNLVTAPTAAPSACTCGCAADGADPPTCANGSFTGGVGTGCATTGLTFPVNGTGCTPSPGGVTVQTIASMGPLPVHLGKCIASVKKDASQLSSKAARVCDPPSSCAEDVCLGHVPPGFAACIAHDGDMPCPGAPFTSRTLAGTAPNLTCGGCATCTNAASCGTATFRYYNDSACATELASRVADGKCNALASGAAGGASSHFRYDVLTTVQACVMGSTATTGVGLDGQMTVCCR